MIAQAINTDTYLEQNEIPTHLKNVEYIIMATPAPSHFKDTPVQFTFFLNTQEKFPQDIKDAILDGEIENTKEAAYKFMDKLANKLGLK